MVTGVPLMLIAVILVPLRLCLLSYLSNRLIPVTTVATVVLVQTRVAVVRRLVGIARVPVTRCTGLGLVHTQHTAMVLNITGG